MPELFNVHGFEPPDPVTGRSLCPRVDHGVSGLLPTTWAPVSDSLSLRLRDVPRLALPPTITRRSIMQKVRRHTFPYCYGHSAPTARKCRVSGAFDSARRRAFHRSIALLVHYRSSRSI